MTSCGFIIALLHFTIDIIIAYALLDDYKTELEHIHPHYILDGHLHVEFMASHMPPTGEMLHDIKSDMRFFRSHSDVAFCCENCGEVVQLLY